MSLDKAYPLSPEPFRKAIPSRPQHGGNGILAGLMTRPWFPWQRHSKTGRGCGGGGGGIFLFFTPRGGVRFSLLGWTKIAVSHP